MENGSGGFMGGTFLSLLFLDPSSHSDIRYRLQWGKIWYLGWKPTVREFLSSDMSVSEIYVNSKVHRPQHHRE
jgi:hypothetical protein